MDNETYEIIERGKDVDAFLCSKLGGYILDKAEADRKKAMVALGEADPSDAKLIAKIQENFNTPNKILMWLLSAKEEGEAKQLEEEVREEDSQQTQTGNIQEY